jgi:hypothetical protein
VKLDEIRALFEQTDTSAWHVIEPPTFHTVLGEIRTNDAQELSIRYHSSAAVYREDVALTLEWGLDRHADQTYTPDYLAEFPLEKSIRRTCADVFWNGAVVDRVSLDILENAYLPTPLPHYRHIEDAALTAELEKYTVAAYEVGLARLVHNLEKLFDDFDETLSRAGFEVDTRKNGHENSRT